MSEPSTADRRSAEARQSASLFWGLALAAALVASLIAWAIGEMTHKHFVAPLTTLPGPMSPFVGQLFKDKSEAYTKNVLLTYSAAGAVFGLVLGVAGGLLRPSKSSAVVGGVLGLVLGATATFLAARCLMLIHYRQHQLDNPDAMFDFIVGFTVHAGIAATLGLTSAFAFGVGLGARGKRLFSIALNGMVGGVLGAVVYIVIGALAFPQDNTDDPIANVWAARLVGYIAVAVVGMSFTASAARVQTKAESRSVHEPSS